VGIVLPRGSYDEDYDTSSVKIITPRQQAKEEWEETKRSLEMFKNISQKAKASEWEEKIEEYQKSMNEAKSKYDIELEKYEAGKLVCSFCGESSGININDNRIHFHVCRSCRSFSIIERNSCVLNGEMLPIMVEGKSYFQSLESKQKEEIGNDSMYY
jgi:hypothetical protein